MPEEKSTNAERFGWTPQGFLKDLLPEQAIGPLQPASREALTVAAVNTLGRVEDVLRIDPQTHGGARHLHFLREHYLEGKSYAQIAREEAIGESTVRAAAKDGLGRIRSALVGSFVDGDGVADEEFEELRDAIRFHAASSPLGRTVTTYVESLSSSERQRQILSSYLPTAFAQNWRMARLLAKNGIDFETVRTMLVEDIRSIKGIGEFFEREIEALIERSSTRRTGPDSSN